MARSGEDGFGEFGFRRLEGTQGKDFRKEKQKLKNREFHGGRLTEGNNLIDLD